MTKHMHRYLLLLGAAVMLSASVAMAQGFGEGAPSAPVAAEAPAAPVDMTAPGAMNAATAPPAVAAAPPLDVTAPFTQSLLFSPAEIVALRRAAEGTVMGTAVLSADTAVEVPLRRVIALSGVYLRKPGDWVVWINGKKMTPKDMLPEVMNIQVKRDRVHLKWFDIGLNNVISITLRPHQTYDIVTGVLLPG